MFYQGAKTEGGSHWSKRACYEREKGCGEPPSPVLRVSIASFLVPTISPYDWDGKT